MDDKELIGETIKFKNITQNSIVMIYKNQRNEMCLFYGNKNAAKTSKDDPVETEYFYYKNNQEFYAGDDGSQKYVGELIVFKRNTWIANEDFFTDMFINITNGLEDGVWPDLKTSLNSLSELFEIKSKDELDKTVKGYIGEISFVYWLMNNSNDMEFVKTIFTSYQRKENKKHDFKISKNGSPIKNNIDLEIKSTIGENMSFIMKANQQQDNINDDLIYAFVKYDTLDKEYGISLQQMLEEIFKNLKIDNKTVPNHLLLSSEKYKFNEIRIDAKNIQVNILDNKELPDFFANEDKSIIDQIKYKLNLPEYIKKKLPDYDINVELESLRQKVMDGDK